MAWRVDLIWLLFASSLWSCCNAALNTLKPGEALDSNSSLVSANGKFDLRFRVYDHDLNLSYLVIKWTASHNYAWVANRYTPILYPFGNLVLDRNNTLKITHRDGDAVVLYSEEESSNNSVVATLLDSGNLVLEEVRDDGSAKRVLWQSFDYPGDVLLPGMKLGVNHSNGHNWSLSSWLTEKSAVPGSFTLVWDPNGRELKIKRRGVVYWSSGVFRDGGFENIKLKRYRFSIVSNEIEDSFTYTVVDQNFVPEWLLTTTGRLYDFDDSESLDIGRADYCYGYNTDGGCQTWDQPTKCRHFGDIFEVDYGYFNPTVPTGANATSISDSNTSLSISDCKAACWANCDCVGFIFLFANQTGCRYWTGNLKFIPDRAGYSSSVVYYLTKKSDGSKSHKWIWIGCAIATVLLALCSIFYLLRRRRKLALSGRSRARVDETDWLDLRESDLSNDAHGLQNDGTIGHDLRVFSYESIMAATDSFSMQNKLGEGGFGPVYKGKMPTGREVAIKRLSICSLQGALEFKNELILISELQHTNLVQLLGFCIYGAERMLIYEYLPNKSLDYILFDSTRGKLLDWKKRFNIIEGIAQGLLYLHRYSRLKVIHRDLKASNILLDENMNPKISDFGLARIFTLNEVEANTNRIVGTYGYMSPEYAMEGIFSGKSDVFSFGVLMLEIISGRKNNSFHNAHRSLNLVGYAWELWKEGAGLELMDSRLSESVVEDQLLRCIHVGLLCVEENADDRPTMSDAISMLTNESLQLPMPKKPAFFPVRHVAEADVSENRSDFLSAELSNSFVIGR